VLPVAQPLLAVHNKAAGRRLQEMSKTPSAGFQPAWSRQDGGATFKGSNTVAPGYQARKPPSITSACPFI
jgi:hypothetical protein